MDCVPIAKIIPKTILSPILLILDPTGPSNQHDFIELKGELKAHIHISLYESNTLQE